MTNDVDEAVRLLPPVDELLRRPILATALDTHGRTLLLAAVRASLSNLRKDLLDRVIAGLPDREAAVQAVESRVLAWLDRRTPPTLRRVFNLTGTVLHTNLGRAPLASEAVEAIREAAGTCNLEYDLDPGQRGDRDEHVATVLCRLTGAEAALAVNNNAAAVLLALNSLARRREVVVSRGELIEIGGSFRMPELMARAGCRLVEVGTTNRTHLADYANAIGPRTAALMKVHPSNFAISGFTAAASGRELAGLAHEQGLPFVVDLGSGTLLDLTRYGLPAEPTPQQALADGADLVTFSGDKLLGGPQAGLVVGRRDLVDALQRNPLKRALRLDKTILAALAATLRLHDDPERLPARLPTLRLLVRPESEIRTLADRVARPVSAALSEHALVAVERCSSQIGSGSLPVDRLPSWSLAIRPVGPRRGSQARLEAMAQAFRALPDPVVGRLQDGALTFDLRCLEDEAAFVAQLGHLSLDRAR